MAQKTLNTRLKLKYDTLENWSKIGGTFVPLKGEVCFVEVADNADSIHNAPSILFKVGDGTNTFNALKWGSGLAADVYSWAKAANKPGYTASEVGVNETAFPGLKKTGTVTSVAVNMNGGSKGTVTSSGTIDLGNVVTAIKINGNQKTISAGLVDLGTYLTSHQDISGKQDKAISLAGFTATTVEGALTEAKQAGTNAQATANGKYTKPSAGIPKSDLTAAVQTSLGKADTALQTHQSITTGSANGTIAVAGADVAVKGLAALAYKASLAKGDVGLGNVENKTLDTSVTASSGNYITSGAVKTYVDNAINAVHQFQYEVITGNLPTASAGTMGKIYLKAHAHGNGDSYDEYITVETGSTTKTYSWEKIGNTDIDLSSYAKTADLANYVPITRTVNGKALNANISLGAADVGVNETAFPGLKKTGTITAVTMNGASKGTSGTVNLGTVVTSVSMNGKAVTVSGGAVNLGTVITAHQDISGKQDKLTAGSHIVISGTTIAAAWPTASDSGYAGIGKTGTVTSVAATGDSYISVSGGPITSSGTISVSLQTTKLVTTDDTIILDCGSSTANI